jgi:hypothetical protein
MDLANAISAQCQILDDFVASQEKLKNLPFEPSFKNDGSLQTFIDCINSSGSDKVKEARTLLVDKTADLRDFVLGPAAMVVWPALTVSLHFYFPFNRKRKKERKKKATG